MALFTPALKLKIEARKLGFGFLLRYEHIIGDNEDIQEVRCVFIELPPRPDSGSGASHSQAAHTLCQLR